MELIYQNGYAYAEDTSTPIAYDDAYYQKLEDYDKKPYRNQVINAGRAALVNKYCKYLRVLDIGCGNLRFIDSLANCWAFGYDIMPKTVKQLKKRNLYLDPYIDDMISVDGICFWDSLEHIADPSEILNRVPKECVVFVSLPIFQTLDNLEQAKHYRPNEHWHYWTEQGFLDYMGKHDLYLEERSYFETLAGRESIMTFVFRRQ